MNIQRIHEQVRSYRYQLVVFRARKDLGVIFTAPEGGFLIPDVFPEESQDIKQIFLGKGTKELHQDPDCLDVLPVREHFEAFLSLTLVYAEESL